MHSMLFVVLYIGPEVMMPIFSALAAIGGVLLMFGRNILAMFRRFFRFLREKMAR